MTSQTDAIHKTLLSILCWSIASLAIADTKPELPASEGATPSASAAHASESAQIITDIAHWQHPTKQVLATYKVVLSKVTIIDHHPAFRVRFPFDPQTSPNSHLLAALCGELLEANGNWAYSLESAEDNVVIEVKRARAREISITYRPLDTGAP